jgi:hypothetical protein
MRGFGPAGVTAIQAVLPEIRRLEDEVVRQRVYALLIAALRWQGETGAQALLDAWDALDNFGRSLACVVFGLVKCTEALDPVWDDYRRVRDTDHPGFIGALWALLDLEDPRLPAELYRFLNRRQFFYELMGFLARAGNARSLGHLVGQMVERGRVGGVEPMLAAAAIAHRIGRDATVAALRQYAAGQDDFSDPSDVAGLLLEQKETDIQAVFAIYYRGFRPEDVGEIMQQLDE